MVDSYRLCNLIQSAGIIDAGKADGFKGRKRGKQFRFVANILPPNRAQWLCCSRATTQWLGGARLGKACTLWKVVLGVGECTKVSRSRGCVLVYIPPRFFKRRQPSKPFAICPTIFTHRHLDIPLDGCSVVGRETKGWNIEFIACPTTPDKQITLGNCTATRPRKIAEIS